MNDSRSKSTGWGIALAVGVALILAYWLRYVLIPFVLAGALAYLARPLVRWLPRALGLPRWASALLAFLLFLGICAILAYGVERLAVPQIDAMMTDSKATIEKFLVTLFHGRELHLPGKTLTAEEAARQINAELDKIGENPEQLIGLAVTGFAAMMGFVLTCVLFAFFLFTGPDLARGMLWLVPPHLRPRVRSLAMEIDPMLARYLRGVFFVVLFTSAITYLVTGFVFHVGHAIFLGLAVGLLELIPVLGPILSFVTFGLVAVQQKGYGTIIGFGVFAIVLRLAIDQLVGPLVLGRAARIPAVVVIFAFLAGGVLYGFLGVVLAIPVAATIKIVLTDLYEGPPGPRPMMNGGPD